MGQDKSRITLEQFVDQAARIILNVDHCQVLISFYIMDRNKDKKITQEEFTEYIEEAWTSACRNLSKNITYSNQMGSELNNQNGNIANSIENFMNEEKHALFQKAIEEFSRYDLDHNGYWDYNDFKEWLTKSQHHTISVTYDEHFKFDVPLHLALFSR